MYCSPRTLYQLLRRNPSAKSPLSATTSLTTSHATSGLVSLPNGPYVLLRCSAMAKMCDRSRSRRICWSAGELVSGSPASFWKNQAGVWLCHSSTWP